MSRHLNAGAEPEAWQNRSRLTGVRQEVKYLIDPEEGPELLLRLQAHIPPKQLHGSPQSYRVSIYLDAPDREFSRRALERGSQTTKLRVKEYYQLEGGQPTNDGRCFIEVKARSGSMVEKSRFNVKRIEVPMILEHGPARVLDPAEQADREAFEEARARRPLEPVFIAHYRRYTFESQDKQLRITLDDELTFHIPPRDLFAERVKVAARYLLPPPILVESLWVVEIKCLGLAPPWVAEVLRRRKEADYSKFATGVHALRQRKLLEL